MNFYSNIFINTNQAEGVNKKKQKSAKQNVNFDYIYIVKQ